MFVEKGEVHVDQGRKGLTAGEEGRFAALEVREGM